MHPVRAKPHSSEPRPDYLQPFVNPGPQRLLHFCQKEIVPTALDQLVQNCLAKDPIDRWRSARKAASVEVVCGQSRCVSRTHAGHTLAPPAVKQCVAIGLPTKLNDRNLLLAERGYLRKRH